MIIRVLLVTWGVYTTRKQDRTTYVGASTEGRGGALQHDIGRALRTARVARGLSLRQLAALVHSSPGQLSKVENGSKAPSVELATACDRVLDIVPPIAELARRLAESRRPGTLRPRVIPAQLPHSPSGLFGRDAELAALHRFLAADRGGAGLRCCVLSGASEAGKTTLSVHFGHQVAASFPDGQLYLDLRGREPGAELDVPTALTRLLRGLGAKPYEIPDDPGERLAIYRSVIADRNVLVVLDDAVGSDQVRPLLPGRGASVVLVTSRERLRDLVVREGVAELVVARFSDDVTYRALLDGLGEARLAAEPDAAAALVTLLGGMPLPIRAAVARLREEPTLSIAGYFAELRPDHPVVSRSTIASHSATEARTPDVSATPVALSTTSSTPASRYSSSCAATAAASPVTNTPESSSARAPETGSSGDTSTPARLSMLV